MKRILFTAIALLLLVFSLAACKKESSETPEVEISEDGYVVVNGVKTNYKVDTEDVFAVDTDGYLVVNGIKTDYKVVLTGCEHIWETKTTAPTCTAGGYDTITCKLCDKSVKANEAEKLEHKYSTSYSLDNENHWLACTLCGDKKDKANHTPDDAGLCTVCTIPVSATPGVVYDISADGTYAEVVAYSGTTTKVKIASEYNGLPVKNIYDKAFYDNKTITSVIIPDSVTSIGNSAFEYCDSLTSVTIPNSVTSIGYRAFYWCSSLTSVTFKNTEGWWVSSNFYATSGTSISAEKLADLETAARYLISTYFYCYWRR